MREKITHWSSSLASRPSRTLVIKSIMHQRSLQSSPTPLGPQPQFGISNPLGVGGAEKLVHFGGESWTGQWVTVRAFPQGSSGSMRYKTRGLGAPRQLCCLVATRLKGRAVGLPGCEVAWRVWSFILRVIPLLSWFRKLQRASEGESSCVFH